MTQETPRPERVTHQHEVVEAKRALRGSGIPYDYVASHIESASKSCCKNVDNLEYHTEKTDPSLPEANKAVITCTCGCKHVRFVGGSAAVNS